MKSEESFDGFLRQEVETAGKCYERAKREVFAMTGSEEIRPDPALLQSIEVLSEAMKVYINALRRLAHYSAHQARAVSQKHLAIHA
jgi:hypothetical protein